MEFASPPPTRKPGRPPTKNTGKARSNSAGAKPNVASSPLKTPPPKTDDLRDDQATPPPETANPTSTSPPPEDTPTSPKVDPEDEAKKKFIKRFQILLEDCQDLVDIYNKLPLNAVLVKQLVDESNGASISATTTATWRICSVKQIGGNGSSRLSSCQCSASMKILQQLLPRPQPLRHRLLVTREIAEMPPPQPSTWFDAT